MNHVRKCAPAGCSGERNGLQRLQWFDLRGTGWNVNNPLHLPRLVEQRAVLTVQFECNV